MKISKGRLINEMHLAGCSLEEIFKVQGLKFSDEEIEKLYNRVFIQKINRSQKEQEKREKARKSEKIEQILTNSLFPFE